MAPMLVLTPIQINEIDSINKLAGYPKSYDFVCGYYLASENHFDLALASFKRGAESKSCVPCFYHYADLQIQRGNIILALPFLVEGSIRGHVTSVGKVVNCLRQAVKPLPFALINFWLKLMHELGATFISEEIRKEMKKDNASGCFVCSKKDLEDNDVTLVTCGICKSYSYCGKNCQTRHWKEGKHMNECRQVIILRKYCKPSYVKEIREAIIDGKDPKEIDTLQRLRMKIGLNRPKEEYEELMLHFNNDDNNNTNTMKRGMKVKVKGLVKATKHNGKAGIVLILSKLCTYVNGFY